MTAPAPTPLPQHRFRSGSARAALLLPRFPHHVDRLVRFEHRHVDAERRAARVRLPTHGQGLDGRPARLRPARAAADPGHPRRRDRRSIRPSPVADRHADRAAGVLGGARTAGSPPSAAIWALFVVQLGVGIGNASNAPAWSAMLPTLVDTSRPARCDLTQLGDDQRVACRRPDHRRRAQCDGRHDVADLPHQRRHLSVRGRRPLLGASRRPDGGPSMETGWRLLTSGIRSSGPARCSARILLTLTTFSLFCVAVRRIVPGCRPAQLRHRREVAAVQVALRDLGFRSLPRRPGRRHGASSIRTSVA